jgi:hypothetical protein
MLLTCQTSSLESLAIRPIAQDLESWLRAPSRLILTEIKGGEYC